MDVVGSYAVGPPIAAGGSSTVHLACVCGPEGFRRTVVIKRLRRELIGDPVARELLLHEARIASQIHQSNVVAVLDLIQLDDEILLVSEYVHGVSVAALLRASGPVPLAIAAAVVRDVLDGLHAAHGASIAGHSLGIVHRDVSPDNVLVGIDGTARVVDFGIARALGRPRLTSTGEVRGKLAYASPEHVNGETLDGRSDVYGAGVLLWEALAGRPLFDARPGPDLLEQIGIGLVAPVRAHRPDVPKELCALILRALSASPADRPSSAAAMARDIERASPTAPSAEVAAWVARVGMPMLEDRDRMLRAFEEEAAELATTSTSPPGGAGGVLVTGHAPGMDEPPAANQEAALAAATHDRAADDARAPETAAKRVGSRASRTRLAMAGALLPVCLIVVAAATLADRASNLPPESGSPVLGSAQPLLSPPSSAVPPAAHEEEPVSAPRSRRKTTIHTPSVKPGYAAGPDCERPYELDANGHKTYKRACLSR